MKPFVISANPSRRGTRTFLQCLLLDEIRKSRYVLRCCIVYPEVQCLELRFFNLNLETRMASKKNRETLFLYCPQPRIRLFALSFSVASACIDLFLHEVYVFIYLFCFLREYIHTPSVCNCPRITCYTVYNVHTRERG